MNQRHVTLARIYEGLQVHAAHAHARPTLNLQIDVSRCKCRARRRQFVVVGPPLHQSVIPLALGAVGVSFSRLCLRRMLDAHASHCTQS